eukprot:gene4538-5135_t
MKSPLGIGLVLTLILSILGFLDAQRSIASKASSKPVHFIGSLDARGKVANEGDEKHGEVDRNKGSTLDTDNTHKIVRNKGKPPKEMQQSTISKTGRLVNRFHWMIQVRDLSLLSTRDSDTPNAKMNVTSIAEDVVQIKGIKADAFICMNSQSGELFVSKTTSKNCHFKEHLEDNFHSSYRLDIPNSEWYLGINEKGKFLVKNSVKPDFATLFTLIS